MEDERQPLMRRIRESAARALSAEDAALAMPREVLMRHHHEVGEVAACAARCRLANHHLAYLGSPEQLEAAASYAEAAALSAESWLAQLRALAEAGVAS